MKNELVDYSQFGKNEQEIDNFMRLIKKGACSEAFIKIMKNP
jgi:hypothetical protein